MFFRSRKRQKSGGGASHTSDPASNWAETSQSRQRDSWRRSAQKVTRAWNEWLAADGRQRPQLFGCYVRALTEEEQATAALERMLHLGARGRPAWWRRFTAYSSGNATRCGS
jgi:hypothetical protein